MSGTKLVCPHCKAILKSSKSLKVGKKITCVKCKQPFSLTTDMFATSASDTATAAEFSLLDTQAGAMKSPIVGVNLPGQDGGPATAVTLESLPKRRVGPVSLAEDTAPQAVRRTKFTHGSLAAVWAALALVLLVLLLVAGVGLGYLLWGLDRDRSDPKPTAEVKKNKIQEKSQAPAPLPEPKIQPQQKKNVPAAAEPIKQVGHVVETPAPVKPDDTLQAKIDASTRKGIQFLKQTLKPTGTWQDDTGLHSVGYAALPGLALLECGVPASDPIIQQAASHVRARVGQAKETYDIGTAILFLDCLGESSDKKVIQNLALRLMAGQTPGGGWTYECPLLSDDEQLKLLEFLNSHKPVIKFLIPLQNTITDGSPRKEPPAGIEKTKTPEPTKPESKLEQKAPKNPKSAQDALPRKLRDLPIVAHQIKKLGYMERSADDNSNTHFALLGLWAARRHQTPVELSLGLAAERFQKTQAKDGGWGYVVRSPPKNTMTCVGLMGLAMGHGSAAQIFADSAKSHGPAKSLAKDPAIQQALKALGQYLDGDESLRGLEVRIDLYYLWSLERVGMLYRQKHFGKKDWFIYGAELILERQHPDGRWQLHYDSPIDTAFALLFLNRSNLVQDLTNSLHSYLEIPDATLLDQRPWRDPKQK
jgi:hypothetical protein